MSCDRSRSRFCAVSFGLFLLLYVAPLLAQIPDLSYAVTSAHRFWGSVEQIQTAMLVCALLVGMVGGLSLTGWARWGWCALLTVLALSVLRPESAIRSVPDSLAGGVRMLLHTAFLQICLLLVVPAHLLLGRLGQPVQQWARGALACTLVLQGGCALLQFAPSHHPALRSFLFEAGLWQNRLYTLRDGHSVYEGVRRFTGLVHCPNLLGAILVLTWPAALGGGKFLGGSRSFAPAGGDRLPLVALGAAAVALTYSRAAYLGLFVQMTVLAVLAWRSGRGSGSRRRWLRILATALTAFSLAVAALPAAENRIQAIIDTQDRSILHRLTVYSLATELLLERPLSGWGVGYFHQVYNRLYRIPWERYSYYNTHSAVLNALLEVGLCGAGLFILICAGTRWRLLWPRLPVWAWLGPAGALISLIADNQAANPAFAFPMVLIIAAWVRVSSHVEWTSRRIPGRGSNRVAPVLAGAFFLFWGVGQLLPVRSFDSRFQAALQQAWPEGTCLSYYVHDLRSGRTWQHQADLSMPISRCIVSDERDTDGPNGNGLEQGRLTARQLAEFALCLEAAVDLYGEPDSEGRADSYPFSGLERFPAAEGSAVLHHRGELTSTSAIQVLRLDDRGQPRWVIAVLASHPGWGRMEIPADALAHMGWATYLYCGEVP